MRARVETVIGFWSANAADAAYYARAGPPNGRFTARICREGIALPTAPSRSPLTATAWFIGLAAVLPLTLTAGRTQPVSATYLMQWFVVAHSAAGLALVLSGVRLRPMQLGFWVFCYLWLGVAPLAQLAVDTYPTSNRYPAGTTFATSALIELGLVGFTVGALLAGYRRPAARSVLVRVLTGRELRRARIFALGVFALVFALYLVPRLGGVGTFFTSRQAANEAITRGQSASADTTANAIRSWGLFVPAFWALLGLLQLPRRELSCKVFYGFGWALLAGLIALNVIVNNPISQPRFWAGTVILGIGFSTKLMRRPRVFRWGAATVAIALLLVFPYSDLFRYTKSGPLTVTSVSDQLVHKDDYDSYQQMQAGLDYVQHTGFHPKAALGPVLFWVPRSHWAGKPEDSGVVFARYAGDTLLNRSSPLWIESYLWGGPAVVAVLFCLLGAFERRLDDIYQLAAGSGRMLAHALVPTLAFFQLILLRGSLLQAIWPCVLLLGVPLLLSRRRRVEPAGLAQTAPASPNSTYSDQVAELGGST